MSSTAWMPLVGIGCMEAWKQSCPDTSPEALMFPTFGRDSRKGAEGATPREKLLQMADYPIKDKLGIPRKLLTFQVMRRTLETDLQDKEP